MIAHHQIETRPWLAETAISDIEARYPDCAVLKMRGDCMCPTIREDDYALIDLRQTRFREDDIYALQEPGGHVLVRRVQRIFAVSGWVRIACDNPRYDSHDLELMELTIVGRICAIVQRR